MRKNRQSPVRQFFVSRAFLVIALVLAILVALGFARAYYKDYKVRQEISRLQEEVKSLENKKIDSLSLLEYVTSDQYVEDTARVELNMKKPGEQVIFIKDLTEKRDSELETDQEEKELSNPLKWWYYIMHKPINNN